MKKILLGVGVVLVLLVGGAVAFILISRGDTPEELSVEGEGGSQGDTGETPEALDGAWAVQAGEETTAGFRIKEDFTALPDHTAVGRSDEVEGSFTVAGPAVTEGSFTVDLTALEFTDDPPTSNVQGRADAMKGQGLETNDFPEATFELTQPIDIGADAGNGETITTEATGELTLHGVTEEITFAVDAKVDGATIRVASSDPVPIALTDYDMEEPTAPFIASVADEGSFEFLLIFEQG